MRQLFASSLLTIALCAGLATSAHAQDDAKKPAAAPEAPAAEKAKGLKVGDKAPELKVAKFVKGEPVTGFEKGTVYVVEFWATWCGPCKTTIPHLTELQKQFGDKLAVIGVSVWERDQSKVVPYVEQMGDKMAYRVAMDDVSDKEGFMANNWMKASKQNGIPTAFVVDKAGMVAWIGHPMDGLDSVVGKVIDGTFDPKKAAEEAQAKEEKEKKIADEMKKVRKTMRDMEEAAKNEEWDKAIAKADEAIALAPSMAGQINATKFHLLFEGAKDYPRAYALAKQLSEGALKDDPRGLNEIAWTILDTEGVAKADRNIELAMTIAARACELTKNEDGMILDTLARAYFEQGNLDKAIELQITAVAKAPANDEMKDEMQITLDKYKAAKAAKK